jgi:hypothetical protein
LCAALARTGIFFCVTTTTLSFPRTPMDVTPTDLIALNAYSVSNKGRGGERKRGGESGHTQFAFLSASSKENVKGYFASFGDRHAPTWYKRPSGEKMVMWRS